MLLTVKLKQVSSFWNLKQFCINNSAGNVLVVGRGEVRSVRGPQTTNKLLNVRVFLGVTGLYNGSRWYRDMYKLVHQC